MYSSHTVLNALKLKIKISLVLSMVNVCIKRSYKNTGIAIKNSTAVRRGEDGYNKNMLIKSLVLILLMTQFRAIKRSTGG